MTYCYLVFMYQPKYKYDGFIIEGHYKAVPKVFCFLADARAFCKNYKHATYIRKVRLYV